MCFWVISRRGLLQCFWFIFTIFRGSYLQYSGVIFTVFGGSYLQYSEGPYLRYSGAHLDSTFNVILTVLRVHVPYLEEGSNLQQTCSIHRAYIYSIKGFHTCSMQRVMLTIFTGVTLIVFKLCVPKYSVVHICNSGIRKPTVHKSCMH